MTNKDLLYSTWKSAQCDVAAWTEGEFGGEWIHVWASQGHGGKESGCQCSRHKKCRLIPGSGRSPGVGNGNPLQYSCLENSMDRGV